MTFKKQSFGRTVMVNVFCPSTQKAEAGRSLRVRGQSSLQSEFQNSQDYTEKPCLKKQKQLLVI